MRFSTRNAPLAGAIFAAVFALSAVACAQSTTTTTITRHRNFRGGVTQVIHVDVNQQPVTFSGPGPVMVDGAVMVPVRGVFENMGGQVQWMPQAKVVEGARPGHMFRLRLGSDQAMVDGNQQTLSTPPQLIDGTTYIPLRFASQALGAHVDWRAPDRTVVITTEPDGTVTTTTTHSGPVLPPTTPTRDRGTPPPPPNP